MVTWSISRILEVIVGVVPPAGRHNAFALPRLHGTFDKGWGRRSLRSRPRTVLVRVADLRVASASWPPYRVSPTADGTKRAGADHREHPAARTAELAVVRRLAPEGALPGVPPVAKQPFRATSSRRWGGCAGLH